MTLTTDQPTIVDAPAPPPTRTTPRPHRRRGAVTWVVALAGLGAAATLTVAAVMTDDGPTTVDISRAVIERGSVSAIDHRDQAG